MKLVTFTHGGSTRIGIVEEDGVIDLSKAAPELPTTMLGLLEGGPKAMTRASATVDGAETIPLADVKLEAPIHRPPKFIGVGLNYADHVAESGIETPKFPTLFNKQSTCVIGPDEPMHLPRASHVLDYEGELGFVIGRRCRHVSRDDARDVIAGYLIVNDATVRDWQLRIPTWTIGKSFDTHGPIGPWLVTADEIPDPHALRLRTWVNDELRQDSNTKELIFDCFTLVEHMSTAFTLEPGDIIATGTPSGVGIAQKPPKLLVAGDRVKIEIEGLGSIENPVIEEPADSGFVDEARAVGIYDSQHPDVKAMKGLHLFHFFLSNCSQRVRFGLEEKGLKWESHHLDLPGNEHVTSDYQQINPKGVVPTLVHDGQVVVESNDILSYLDEHFPEPPLQPASADERERMNERVAAASGAQAPFKVLSHELVFRRFRKVGPEEIALFEEKARDRSLVAFLKDYAEDGTAWKARVERANTDMARLLDGLEAALEQDEWLSGSSFGLADISWIVNTNRLQQAQFGLDRWPRLVEWTETTKSRPAFEKAVNWRP